MDPRRVLQLETLPDVWSDGWQTILKKCGANLQGSKYTPSKLLSFHSTAACSGGGCGFHVPVHDPITHHVSGTLNESSAFERRHHCSMAEAWHPAIHPRRDIVNHSDTVRTVGVVCQAIRPLQCLFEGSI